MAVIGVVGEFNPFHLGHFEHLRLSRAQVDEHAITVCVMSGDFVQRGAPAAFDKHIRARAAAQSGADLVFELPLPWAVASAERFAMGAVGLLHSLGVVTHLSFGTEAGDLASLKALAKAAVENIDRIKERMADGMSFAGARESVLRSVVGESARLLQKSNNILAVEYIKSLQCLGSDMIPMTTHRTNSEHDMFSAGPVRSARQLRSMLEAGEDIKPYVPEAMGRLVAKDMAQGRGPVIVERLEQGLMARLRALTQVEFDALPDATEGLGNRLYRAVQSEGSIDAILSAVKTKRYPLSRLRRLLICAALGVRTGMTDGTPPYARLLASTERGRELLREISRRSSVPVITKPAAAKELLSDHALDVFCLTAAARDFYVLGYEAAEERRGGSDWKISPATL